MALQEYGDADLRGFEVVRAQLIGMENGRAHQNGWREQDSGFVVDLSPLTAFVLSADSGSGIVTSLLPWMNGSWLELHILYIPLACADGRGYLGLAE